MGLVKLTDKDTFFKFEGLGIISLQELGVRALQEGGRGPSDVVGRKGSKAVYFRVEGNRVLRILYQEQVSGSGRYYEKDREVA